MVVAIILQSKELALQRRELRMTRKVVKEQADAQKKSEESFRRQAEMLATTAFLSAAQALRVSFDQGTDMETPVGRNRKVSARQMENAMNHTMDRLGQQLEGGSQLWKTKSDDLERFATLCEAADIMEGLIQQARSGSPELTVVMPEVRKVRERLAYGVSRLNPVHDLHRRLEALQKSFSADMVNEVALMNRLEDVMRSHRESLMPILVDMQRNW